MTIRSWEQKVLGTKSPGTVSMAMPGIASKTVLLQNIGRKSRIFLVRPLFNATVEDGPVGVSPTAIENFRKVIITIIITDEYDLGGTVALLLQDHVTLLIVSHVTTNQSTTA